MRLLADTQFADHITVTVGIALLQVVQKTTALAHEHQQPATRSVVLLVGLEVLRQLADTLAQNRDLYLGAPGILVVCAKLRNNVCFLSRC